MADEVKGDEPKAGGGGGGNSGLIVVFVPPVPARLPVVGDRVCFVLRALGKGVTNHPKVRAATVTEAWQDEDHPTGRVRGPDGKEIFGGNGKPFVPAGCVNLEIHLDGFARRDHNEGHNKYEGHVLYDPDKGYGTWHWPGE